MVTTRGQKRAAPPEPPELPEPPAPPAPPPSPKKKPPPPPKKKKGRGRQVDRRDNVIEARAQAALITAQATAGRSGKPKTVRRRPRPRIDLSEEALKNVERALKTNIRLLKAQTKLQTFVSYTPWVVQTTKTTETTETTKTATKTEAATEAETQKEEKKKKRQLPLADYSLASEQLSQQELYHVFPQEKIFPKHKLKVLHNLLPVLPVDHPQYDSILMSICVEELRSSTGSSTADFWVDEERMRTAIDKVLATGAGCLAEFLSSNQRFKFPIMFPMLDKLCEEFIRRGGPDMLHIPHSQIESIIRTMMLEKYGCETDTVSEYMKDRFWDVYNRFDDDPTYSLTTNCRIATTTTASTTTSQEGSRIGRLADLVGTFVMNSQRQIDALTETQANTDRRFVEIADRQAESDRRMVEIADRQAESDRRMVEIADRQAESDRRNTELHNKHIENQANTDRRLVEIAERQAESDSRNAEINASLKMQLEDHGGRVTKLEETTTEKLAEMAAKVEEISQALKKKNEQFPGVVVENTKTEARKAKKKEVTDEIKSFTDENDENKKTANEFALANKEHEHCLLNTPEFVTEPKPEFVTESTGGMAFAIHMTEGPQPIHNMNFF